MLLNVHRHIVVCVQVLKNSTEMYSEKDLYVGKTLTVHQRTFELLEADEFTYQYMENNRHVYLMADWESALKAIQAQLQGMCQCIIAPQAMSRGLCNRSSETLASVVKQLCVISWRHALALICHLRELMCYNSHTCTSHTDGRIHALMHQWACKQAT